MSIPEVLRRNSWAVLVLAAVSLGVTVWLLVRPPPAPPDDMAARISASVDSAGVVCLSDLNETKSKEVQTGISLALKSIGGQGKISETQVRSSVNLAIDQSLLLQERTKVRECMQNTVPRFLAAHGIISKPDSANSSCARPNLDVASLQSELEKVRNDVNVWDNAITETEVQIPLDKAKAEEARSGGKLILAEALDKNVKNDADLLSIQKSELARSTERRKELEDLLARTACQ